MDKHPALTKAALKYGLTKREQEALSGILGGLSNKELAAWMNISPNTVKAFIHIVMLKMGASTRAEIAERIRSVGGEGTESSHEHSTGPPGIALPKVRRAGES